MSTSTLTQSQRNRSRSYAPLLSDRQTQALAALSKPDEAAEVLYGGAKYGGKSYFLCTWGYLESQRLIKQYHIPQADHPIPVGFIGRKTGTDFRKTTLETWYKAIPSDLYRMKGNPVEIIIDDRVKIYTGGLDKSETIQKFNSAELAFYGIDQAEEITRDDIMVLRAAVFWRLSINGHKVPGKGLLTANPRDCWLKKEFIDRR